MGAKLSPFLDDQLESGVNRIASVVLRERDEQELSSAVELLQNTILPFGNGDHPIPLRGGEWQESDNYQIALVPLRDNADRTNKSSRTPLGAKPVIVLPLSWRELVVRLRAVADASRSVRESSVVRFGNVSVDFPRMEVSRSDKPVPFTAMEFKLLKFLVQNPDRVMSRDEILNRVWGYENYPCTRTVDNHILRLRQKLEPDPASPVHFHTVHGVGYKFVFAGSRVVTEAKVR